MGTILAQGRDAAGKAGPSLHPVAGGEADGEQWVGCETSIYRLKRAHETPPHTAHGVHICARKAVLKNG